MTATFFITGTDTGVGKTLATCALLTALNKQQQRTLAIKPVAAGCQRTAEGLRNDDAINLLNAMSVKLSYQQVNPVALEAPIAPHIAAGDSNHSIDLTYLTKHCQNLARQADYCLIEGAGGWRVPLNPKQTLADLAVNLQAQIILVIAMRLGCINHSLLTLEAIHKEGLYLAGWITNQVNNIEMERLADNIATLKHYIQSHYLGHIPYLSQSDFHQASHYLNINAMMKTT